MGPKPSSFDKLRMRTSPTATLILSPSKDEGAVLSIVWSSAESTTRNGDNGGRLG